MNAAAPEQEAEGQAPAEAECVRELGSCELDPVYLIDKYGVIDNVQESGDEVGGDTIATIPFRLWPHQAPVFTALMEERQVLILKARQLGISWVVCGFVLWLCLFHPGRVVLMFSKGQLEANELIRRISVLYSRLPDWLRDLLPSLTVNNVKELKWSNGSRVQGMPATASAGVSFTASLIVLDEAAKMTFGRQLYASAKPTIDGGGKIIVLSTANGFGGFFHNLWTKTESGATRFKGIFLPWWARPGRDRDWYDGVVKDADDTALIPQEYPANPIEAFVASGRLRFNPAHVAAQAANIQNPFPASMFGPALLARKFWPGLRPVDIPTLSEIPGLAVYKDPVPGRKYVIAADVAEGKDPEGKRDSDYDAAPVVDAETWEEVACLHGRWEPDVYALYLIALSEAYNGAVMVVERNNHGHAVLLEFKHRRVPFERVGLGHDGWPGWLTNAQTKPEGTTLLSAALRDGLITVRTRRALYEMHVYSVLKNGNTGAPAGDHDDLVSAWAILLSYLRHRELVPDDGTLAVGGEPARVTGHITR